MKKTLTSMKYFQFIFNLKFQNFDFNFRVSIKRFFPLIKTKFQTIYNRKFNAQVIIFNLILFLEICI